MKPNILIIGGGLIGLTCALAAHDAGWRVQILDPSPAWNSAASGSPTGVLLPPHGRLADTRFGRLARSSRAFWPTWADDLTRRSGIRVPLLRCGALRLHPTRPLVLPPDVRWQPHAWGLPGGRGGVEVPDAAHVLPHSVGDALAAIVTRLGIPRLPLRATRLIMDAGRVLGVQTETESIPTETTLIAAGTGASALLHPLGLGGDLGRDGGVVIQISGVPEPPGIVAQGAFTLVPKPDGSIWVSGLHRGPQTGSATAEEIAILLDAAEDILGTRGRVQDVWVGVRPIRGGGVWVDAPMPGLLVAIGHGGNGYLLAPGTAQTVSDMLRSRQGVAAQRAA